VGCEEGYVDRKKIVGGLGSPQAIVRLLDLQSQIASCCPRSVRGGYQVSGRVAVQAVDSSGRRSAEVKAQA